MTLLTCCLFYAVSEFKFNFCLCLQRLDIAKLNDLINKAEESMVQLRKRYESAVQERNDM